jgi:redox-sensitive bicupin YhaK (pirin superfamily)
MATVQPFDPSQPIVHRANSRGRAETGWLHSWHTFSFGHYHDPQRMGFGALRVINDDTVEPAEGFDLHPHRNMEIITIPIAGALKHHDSEGSAGVIRKGDVQIMSAGTGIEHSEHNASDTETVNFLQIWVFPKAMNIPPRYEQKAFPESERHNRFQVIVSPLKDTSSLWINQDAFFSLAQIDAGGALTYQRRLNGNGVYVFVIEGAVSVLGESLARRDAIAVPDASELTIKAARVSEILVIEVPRRIS